MNLKDLVAEAARLDPQVEIVVWDTATYRSGKATGPLREVKASVTSRHYGEGSAEDIMIEMGGDRHTLDQVRRVVPGRTTLFWQADPLVRALSSSAVAASE